MLTFENYPSINTPINASNLNANFEELDGNIGDLGSLETAEKTDLVNAINEIFDNTVVEKGNNSNGNWIKFGSGIMMCWKNLTEVIDITNAYGNSNMYSGTISLGNLPQVFVETPFMDFNNNGTPFAIPIYNSSPTTSWGNVRVLYPTQLSDYAVNIRAIAIGYWK